jgi:hypothetical protein
MRRSLVLGLALLAFAFAAAPATAGTVGGQFRYWSFSDQNDNRNPLLYYAPGPFHVQLEVWDFEHGEDQFRPELGVHLRDARRSSYTAQWRHENRVERLTLGSEQVLAAHWVGKASLTSLLEADSIVYVWSAGADYYWHSYSFASADVIRDPRGDDLWVVPLRVRLANERNDWLQFTLAPASKRTLGWAADTRLHGLRLGVERNSRFDFSTRDNLIFTLGVELALPKPVE